MKTCPTCSAIHADEYNGTCPHCGAQLGTLGGSTLVGGANLARAAVDAARLEQRFKNREHGDIPIPDRMLETARRFVIQTPPADA